MMQLHKAAIFGKKKQKYRTDYPEYEKISMIF
jgi:hypothetical protein